MTPCPSCPFRIGSALGYDEDATAVLRAGYEPACHAIVGPHLIFDQPVTRKNRCRGYVRWLADDKQFAEPKLVE